MDECCVCFDVVNSTTSCCNHHLCVVCFSKLVRCPICRRHQTEFNIKTTATSTRLSFWEQLLNLLRPVTPQPSIIYVAQQALINRPSVVSPMHPMPTNRPPSVISVTQQAPTNRPPSVVSAAHPPPISRPPSVVSVAPQAPINGRQALNNRPSSVGLAVHPVSVSRPLSVEHVTSAAQMNRRFSQIIYQTHSSRAPIFY